MYDRPTEESEVSVEKGRKGMIDDDGKREEGEEVKIGEKFGVEEVGERIRDR